MRGKFRCDILYVMIVINLIFVLPIAESQQSVDITKHVLSTKPKALFGSANILSIKGTRYNDSNSNGVMDDGENGLAGAIIRLMQNGTQIAITTTDEHGHYSFNNLSKGLYLIVEEKIKGWNQTSPRGGSYNVTLTDKSIHHLDFGDTGGITISGPQTVMHFTREQYQQALGTYKSRLLRANSKSVRQPIPKQPLAAGEQFSLLNYLTYTPADRVQGSCGNCWVWGSTPMIEIDNAKKNNVYDRLSIQYFSSNYNSGTGCDFDCCGGWPVYVANFYCNIAKKVVPWNNSNAGWGPSTDEGRCCDTTCGPYGCSNLPHTTAVPANTITEIPNYPLNSVTDTPINDRDQIKTLLKNGYPLAFTFFQTSSSFGTNWSSKGETDVWTPDGALNCNIGTGNVWGHTVACVGYNDTDPSNPYWIMLNSWGNPSNRQNGLFAVTMNLDYNCGNFQFDTFDIKWPNKFGYTYIDSNTAGGPAYDWTEIAGSGTEVLQNSDDSYADQIPLGFSFNYFGTSYNKLIISNNGMLAFGQNAWQYINQPIPNSPVGHGFIAPYWDDLVSRNGGHIYYQTVGIAPNRKFVVEWLNNQHFHSSSIGITFEVILNEGSNNIQFQYQSTSFGTVSDDISSDLPPYDNGGSATVGIERPDGNDGLEYSYNQQEITPGLAILFKYPQRSSAKIGVFRPSQHTFYLDVNGDRKWDTGDLTANFGISGDLPIVGDWNGDGKTKVGIYRPYTHEFFLDFNGNRAWDIYDVAFRTFGISGDLPIAGDWNGDGRTEIGVYRPSQHTFYLDYNGNRAWNAGDVTASFGISGDLPIVGDWNGDGKTEIGIFRPSQHTFYLDYNGNRAWNAGDVTASFGISGDLPVVGDWNGDGKTEIGIFRPSQHTFYLDYNGNRAWDAGDVSASFGITGDKPVAGRWG